MAIDANPSSSCAEPQHPLQQLWIARRSFGEVSNLRRARQEIGDACLAQRDQHSVIKETHRGLEDLHGWWRQRPVETSHDGPQPVQGDRRNARR